MLSLIIADLKNKVDDLTSQQNKLLSEKPAVRKSITKSPAKPQEKAVRKKPAAK